VATMMVVVAVYNNHNLRLHRHRVGNGEAEKQD
jgi:hypothetical protein